MLKPVQMLFLDEVRQALASLRTQNLEVHLVHALWDPRSSHLKRRVLQVEPCGTTLCSLHVSFEAGRRDHPHATYQTVTDVEPQNPPAKVPESALQV